MKVGIIGLGLIGGSMAIDLRRRGFADEVLGVEAEPVNAASSDERGAPAIRQSHRNQINTKYGRQEIRHRASL